MLIFIKLEKYRSEGQTLEKVDTDKIKPEKNDYNMNKRHKNIAKILIDKWEKVDHKTMIRKCLFDIYYLSNFKLNSVDHNTT